MLVLTKTTAKGSRVEVWIEVAPAGRRMIVHLDGRELLTTSDALDGEVVRRVEIPAGMERKPAWQHLLPLSGKYAVIADRAIVFSDAEAEIINSAWRAAETESERRHAALPRQRDLVARLAAEWPELQDGMRFVRARPVEQQLEAERQRLTEMEVAQ